MPTASTCAWGGRGGGPGARAGPGRLAELLDSTRQTDKLRATVATLVLGPLVLRDLRLRKDGSHLAGEAGVTQEDLAAAMPPGVGLRPVASQDGSLVLEAQAGP